MKKRPLISIVTPVFNGAKTITRTIDSVANQSCQDWEYIIVDDGSTDNTEDIVEPWIKDNRIKYCRKENAGVSSARNYGAEKASGEYLIFLDCDDELCSDYLKNVYNQMEEKLVDIYFSGSKIIHKQQRSRKILLVEATKQNFFSRDNGLYISGCFCISKYIFESVNGYDESLSYSENMELAIRLEQMIHTRIFVKNNYHIYNQSIDQRTRSSLTHKSLTTSLLHILRKHIKLFQFYPREHCKYLSIIGVSFIKNGKPKIAQLFFLKACKLYPLDFRNIFRLLISSSKMFSGFIWR